MELKVWVDGIQRVVCGVTDNTTCQDIVIALAQAMGRTGRFTLIEKWRDNERPLSPADCPLLVLQKWGEFASEVKLILYESGTRRKQKQAEKHNEIQKDTDRFTHNFTPPVKTSEAVIRRSLTFSGGRKQEQGPYQRKPENIADFPRQASLGSQGLGPAQNQNRHLLVPSKGTSDGNSFSSSSSLSSQNSATLPKQPQPRRRRSSSHDRVTSRNDHETSSSNDALTSTTNVQKPMPVQHSSPSPQYSVNGPKFSNLQPQFSQKSPHYSMQGSHVLDEGPQTHHPGNSRTLVSSSIPNNFTFQHYKQQDIVQNGPSRNYPTVSNPPAKPFQTEHVPNGPYHSRSTVGSRGHSPVVSNEPVHNKHTNINSGQQTVAGSSNNSHMVNGHIYKQPVANGPVHPSAFSPIQKVVSGETSDTQRISKSNLAIPIYTDVRKSSQKHEAEEYDLDSNFPDVVKETGKDRLIEEFHVPGSQGHGHQRNPMSREEEERVKLLRLVTMQNERIKMQDSQLDIIDTEITSREQKIEDLKIEIDKVTGEIDRLSKVNHEQVDEIGRLDNGTLIDEIEQEKQNEREIKTEISALKSRLQKCENDLRQFQAKVQHCSKDLEKENEILKTDEKRRKEEEIKLQADISELKKEVDSRSQDMEKKSKEYENVAKELEQVMEELKKKEEDLLTTQKEIERENLKFFQPPQGSDGTSLSGKKDGEAVLKVLEGSLTPKLKRSKMLDGTLNMHGIAKKEGGVWV